MGERATGGGVIGLEGRAVEGCGGGCNNHVMHDSHAQNHRPSHPFSVGREYVLFFTDQEGRYFVRHGGSAIRFFDVDHMKS